MTPQTRLADLTIQEFQQLLRKTVLDLLEEMADLQDNQFIEKLWQEQPEAFMSLEQFNQALDQLDNLHVPS